MTTSINLTPLNLERQPTDSNCDLHRFDPNGAHGTMMIMNDDRRSAARGRLSRNDSASSLFSYETITTSGNESSSEDEANEGAFPCIIQDEPKHSNNTNNDGNLHHYGRVDPQVNEEQPQVTAAVDLWCFQVQSTRSAAMCLDDESWEADSWTCYGPDSDTDDHEDWEAHRVNNTARRRKRPVKLRYSALHKELAKISRKAARNVTVTTKVFSCPQDPCFSKRNKSRKARRGRCREILSPNSNSNPSRQAKWEHVVEKVTQLRSVEAVLMTARKEKKRSTTTTTHLNSRKNKNNNNNNNNNVYRSNNRQRRLRSEEDEDQHSPVLICPDDVALSRFLSELQHRDITPEDFERLMELEALVKPKTLDEQILNSHLSVGHICNDQFVNVGGSTKISCEGVREDTCVVCMDDLVVASDNGGDGMMAMSAGLPLLSITSLGQEGEVESEVAEVLRGVLVSVGSQKVARLPCGHVFHEACIRAWLLERSHKCPMDNLPVLF